MLKIDRVLELLAKDTEWHSIVEIAEKTDLPVQQIMKIAKFLATHKFISLNEQGKRAKIEECTSRFLIGIQAEEKLLAR